MIGNIDNAGEQATDKVVTDTGVPYVGELSEERGESVHDGCSDKGLCGRCYAYGAKEMFVALLYAQVARVGGLDTCYQMSSSRTGGASARFFERGAEVRTLK